MAIELTDYKNYGKFPVLDEIIEEVKVKPKILEYIARILLIYKVNHEKDFDISDVRDVATRELGKRRLRLSEEKLEYITVLLVKLYELRPKAFNKARSSFLERVVYECGCRIKKTGEQSIHKYMEPKVLDNSIPISNQDNRCDVVLFVNEKTGIDFIECKASISNVIRPFHKEFKDIGGDHQQKLLYLRDCYSYLRDNYAEPYIAICCFNGDYEEEKEKLQGQFGYDFIDIISAGEIGRLLESNNNIIDFK